jgi:L-alanine-DL-glutamate epimerase-like enolase superfamily enzyme
MDQVHVPLVAVTPNGLIVEWMYALGARTADLIMDPIVPKDGMMECKTVPGIGLEISQEAVRKYSTKPTQPGVVVMNPRYQWPPYA